MNAATELGVTPLSLAAENGNPALVTALLEAGASRVVVGTGGYASGAMLAYAMVHGIRYVQQVADAQRVEPKLAH